MITPEYLNENIKDVTNIISYLSKHFEDTYPLYEAVHLQAEAHDLYPITLWIFDYERHLHRSTCYSLKDYANKLKSLSRMIVNDLTRINDILKLPRAIEEFIIDMENIYRVYITIYNTIYGTNKSLTPPYSFTHYIQ